MDFSENVTDQLNLHTVEILNPYGQRRAWQSGRDLHTVEILNPYGLLPWISLPDHLHTVEILNPYGPPAQKQRKNIYTQ